MALEKFHYTTESGKQIALPKFDQIPFGIIRRLRNESESEQFFGMFESMLERKKITQKDMDVLDDLGQSEVQTLMEAWQKDAGISAGESSAS